MSQDLKNIFDINFFKITEALYNLTKNKDLDTMVLGNNIEPQERICSLFCKMYHIPTLNMQYAGGGRVIAALKQGFLKLSSDKIAVWGDDFKEALITSGIDSDKIVVTGNPRFDLLLQLKKEFSKNHFLERYNLKKGKKIIALTLSPFVYKKDFLLPGYSIEESNWNTMLSERRLFFSEIRKIKEKNSDLLIILKPHPRDNIHFVNEFIKDIGVEILINNNIDTYELLAACDILITQDSTVGLEAMIMSKSVICFDYTGNLGANEYVSNGAAMGVSKKGELETSIESIINNDSSLSELKTLRTNFVYKRGYKQDGQSSKRVSDLISSMAS